MRFAVGAVAVRAEIRFGAELVVMSLRADVELADLRGGDGSPTFVPVTVGDARDRTGETLSISR